jgi:hypothetical protein
MHDFEEPTEPMSQVFLPPYSAPHIQNDMSIERNTIPAPPLDERPFPKADPNSTDAKSPANPPSYSVVLPGAPESHSMKYPGDVPYAYPVKPDTFLRRQPRRSMFPALIGFFFLVVELVLLLRLVFLLFGASVSNVWVAFVYTVSTFFLVPFYLLLENVKVPLLKGTEFYSDLLIICAIFVYGLLSRILVRIFKGLLNSR